MKFFSSSLLTDVHLSTYFFLKIYQLVCNVKQTSDKNKIKSFINLDKLSFVPTKENKAPINVKPKGRGRGLITGI